jgi:sugar O-acyltransferase (sialic acid O-acetyltransferase NeuD family)
MKNIVVIGAGGLAKEIAFLIDEINSQNSEWNILGFIDNNNENIGQNNGKYRIYNTDEWLINCNDNISIAFGIGEPIIIKKLLVSFKKNKNIFYPNLIHPNVIGDWDNISMSEGNTLCSGNIFTTDITIGSFNCFNLSCTIGHDSIIGDFNIINPSVNISGGVKLGSEILLGTGSQILQYKQICNKNIIGAGAVVSKNIDESGVYVGIPARKIK